MLRRKPNFFIVGAPKCGTTSLAEWLAKNPKVCMSRPKEPHYFSTEIHSDITSLEEYEACFAHVLPEHIAIGEASPHTMFARRTIENILSYQPDAKFILCLRNPIEMAVSFHNQTIFNGYHEILDFITAWNSTEEIWIPHRRSYFKTCEYYRYITSIGTHSKTLFDQTIGEKLTVLVIDDLIENHIREFERITSFLGVDVHSTTYPRSNTSKQSRSIRLKRALNSIYRAKKGLGFHWSLGIGAALNKANISRSGGAAKLTPEIHAILADHFRPEIVLLEKLLKRDLSHWLVPNGETQG